MGPQTVGAFFQMVSPIVWLCVGAVVLAIVVIKVLVLSDTND